MRRYMDYIIEKYQLQPRQVFLIDGVGALVSAMLLVGLISNFENLFGLPKSTVYSLSIPAFALMVYSLGCYFLNTKSWRPLLTAVAVANILYCILTISVIFSYFKSVTVLGLMYFIGEIGIILFIVGLEWAMVKRKK